MREEYYFSQDVYVEFFFKKRISKGKITYGSDKWQLKEKTERILTAKEQTVATKPQRVNRNVKFIRINLDILESSKIKTARNKVEGVNNEEDAKADMVLLV